MFEQSIKLGTAKISGTGDIELLDEAMRWFLPECGIRRTKSVFNLLRPILVRYRQGSEQRTFALFSRSFVKDKDGRYQLFFWRADDLWYLQKMATHLGFTVTDIQYGDSKPSNRKRVQLGTCTLSVSLAGRSVTFDLTDKSKQAKTEQF
jgi:hypothetical protein